MDTRGLLRTAVPKPVREAVWAADRRVQRAQERAFERWFDIDVGGHSYFDDPGIIQGEGTFYESIQYLPLRRAIAALRPGPEDVFADLGSGKGSALVVAGRFAIKRTIGVELQDDLTVAARRNVSRARPRMRCGEFELVSADVLEWPVPDDLSIVFMYCPFRGELFSQAMGRLIASYDRNPRPLHILYAYPWEHNRLLATGRVEVVDVHPAQWPVRPWWPNSGWVITTARVVPAGSAAKPKRHTLSPLRRQALERWSRPNDQRFRLRRPGVGAITSR